MAITSEEKEKYFVIWKSELGRWLAHDSKDVYQIKNVVSKEVFLRAKFNVFQAVVNQTLYAAREFLNEHPEFSVILSFWESPDKDVPFKVSTYRVIIARGAWFEPDTSKESIGSDHDDL